MSRTIAIGCYPLVEAAVVPESADTADAIGGMVDRLRGRRVVALTGAGISTESGIPDYRSPDALARVRRPIHGPDFVRSAAVRQRYWARAMIGWERFRLARPSAAHIAIAQLEDQGAVTGVITQNVDRLHRAAGTEHVTELHGALAEVICLDCGLLEDRDSVQARMRDQNLNGSDGPAHLRALHPERGARDMADGDAELPDELIEGFTCPACLQCGGTLKPNVVFFGHSVARPIVDEAYARIDDAEALLVAGTSLAVFSGYRFLLRAADRKIPIVIVNRGAVRGEERAALKIEASTGETLAAFASSL